MKIYARGDKNEVEQGSQFMPKFDENGLIPAVAIHFETLAPLMLAYMNEESLWKTLELGEAVYWSRSRSSLWHKGATSGHTQKIVEILVDCDQDALILKVDPAGPGSCHTGHFSCFYRSVPFGEGSSEELQLVEAGLAFDPDKVYH